MTGIWQTALIALLLIDPAVAKHKRARAAHGHLALRSDGLHARADILATTQKTNKKRCAKRVPQIQGAAAANTTKTSTSSAKPKATQKAVSTSSQNGGCFPALGFDMPDKVPGSTKGWWCDPKTEYAFVGFSYEVSQCQSAAALKSQFKDMRNRFKSRYVRLYGACDRNGFYDDVVDAAWEAGLGVQALVWFGFEGTDQWKGRRDSLFNTLHNNPKAKFVTRVVQFGSEPLFDGVLSPGDLSSQVYSAKSNLKSLGIPVTVSDMAWAFQKSSGGATDVLAAMDSVNAHTLPYFASNARGAGDSWGNVAGDITWFQNNAKGKKIWLSENGWPSVSSQGVQPNSDSAYTNEGQEKVYFDLLDSKCSYFKSTAGGVAWFAHIYSDDQEPGYGILRTAGGSPKFNFSPRTHC